MTTPIALRDWRLLAAGCGGLLLLAAAITLHSHWGDFLQWCLATQITLHRYLVMYLLLLNNHQYSGGIWLLVGAFLYGVLHAVGPGHGKFIVTTYLSTNQESLTAARVVPFLGSLLQGVTAILFVFILAVGLNLAAGDLSASRWYVEKISALTIGVFGAYVIFRALQSLWPTKQVIRRLTPAHQHDASCGCGHHGVGQDLQGADWKTRLGVVLAIGVRPCSGAIMILLFANALGIVSWGIAAVMSMALGTALSILGLSLLVHYARHRTVKRLATNHRPRPRAGSADEDPRRSGADPLCRGIVFHRGADQRQRRLYRRWLLARFQQSHQHPQRLIQLLAFTVTESCQQLPFVVDVGFHCGIDPFASGGSQGDQHTAGILRIGQAGNKPAFLQRLQTMGHGTGGNHQRGEELGGRKYERRPGAPQRRQHVKLPAHQIVARKGHFHLRLQQHSASFQATYRPHGAAVEVWPLPLPLGEDAIHGVDRR